MLLRDLLTIIRNTDVDICQYQDGIIKVIATVSKDIHITQYISFIELYGDTIVQFVYASNNCVTIIIE